MDHVTLKITVNWLTWQYSTFLNKAHRKCFCMLFDRFYSIDNEDFTLEALKTVRIRKKEYNCEKPNYYTSFQAKIPYCHIIGISGNITILSTCTYKENVYLFLIKSNFLM